MKPTTEEKVRQLIRRDEQWSLVLHECITVATKQKKESGGAGKFAGAWVMQGLRVKGLTPPSNLRALSSLGLLKLDTTSRGGNRAYYTLTDMKGVVRALKALVE